MTDSVPTTPEARNTSLWWYLAVLLRHSRLLVLMPLVLASLTAVRSLTSPRHYVATASLTPQERSASQSGLGQVAGQLGIALPVSNGNAMELYADLLKSKEVVRGVVLAEYELTKPKPFRGTLVGFLKLDGADENERTLQAIEILGSWLTVHTNRFTDVVRFMVSSPNAELSARIGRNFLNELNEFDLRRRQTSATAQRQFAESRLQAILREFELAESALAAFHRANRFIGDNPELRDEEARLLRRVDLYSKLVLSLSQNRELARIEEARDTPAFSVLSQPELFVEPARRGTVRKTLLALVVGLLLATLLAFGLEASPKTEAAWSREYAEFRALLDVQLRRFRHPARKRPPVE